MIYTIIFAVADEPQPVITSWDAVSHEHAILSICEWIMGGSVPVDVPGEPIRFLPSSIIYGFDIQSAECERDTWRTTKWNDGD